MNTHASARGIVAVSVSLYGLLLRLYPEPFRSEYGFHMQQTFRDCCREAAQKGMAELVVLWAATLVDWFKSVLEETVNGGVSHMSNRVMEKLAGPMFIAAGVLIVFGGLMNFETRTWDRFGGEDLLFELGSLAFALSFVPLLLGFIGMRSRYAEKAGALGHWSLIGAVAACAVTVVAWAPGGFFSPFKTGWKPPVISENWWYIGLYAVMAVFIMLVLFGVAAVQRKILPRWNALPIVVGAYPFLAYLITIAFIPDGQGGSWYGFIGIGVIGVLIALLGYVLMQEARDAEPSAVPAAAT